MQSHVPFAYVYSCYDPKNQTAIFQWCQERFGQGNFILSQDPGAVKNLVSPHNPSFPKFVLWKIDLAHNKVHPCDIIALINHSACGAYADSGIAFTDPQEEEKFHRQELERAAVMMKEKFPGVAIETHYFLKNEQRMAW